MNKNKLVKELVCNFNGDIYIAKFTLRDGFDNLGYNYFLNSFVNYDSIDMVTKEKLEDYLKKFNIEALNTLYNDCTKNDEEVRLVNKFILGYIDIYFDVDMELFCTNEERNAFIKAAILPVFVNQPSHTLDTIRKASYSKMVEDVINNKNNRKGRKR